ncbi:hypothetical protein O181_089188 [Austropuccinia psidii MF-1]|uniref:Integrase catalytic domain-containing protein n=1 Tax=Austropuccinia psidii MF-1 TaxID=1389203 RepID=A0A9Q3IST3_9BASI|nr:hypothetical protein [Austropuccinia psidii MF-1]
MESITQLPLSSNFDSILVVVDRFSKMAIFIPAYSTITCLDLAQIFISHVFSKHGLQISIVSDRGSLFVSSFWTQLWQNLKISRDLSTAFNPGTDGQTERVNQILEQYLHIYVSYHQEDWHTWLPLAEFAYNNAEHSSTKQSHFFTIYGRNLSFDSIPVSKDSPAGKFSTKLQSVNQVFKEELESAIRPTKKSSERWLGYFEVLKNIGSHAYHLKLPQKWKSVNPVFHVSSLEPVKKSTIPCRHQLPPPPVLVEEQEEWGVDQVLDSKLKRGKLWYLVEWKGFSEDPERTTWEPASNLTSSPDLLKDFHSLYPVEKKCIPLETPSPANIPVTPSEPEVRKGKAKRHGEGLITAKTWKPIATKRSRKTENSASIQGKPTLMTCTGKITIIDPVKPPARGLEVYGSSSSAPPTPQRPISMEHGQQEVQPSVPLGRPWGKFPEDIPQRDRLKALTVITKGWTPPGSSECWRRGQPG